MKRAVAVMGIAALAYVSLTLFIYSATHPGQTQMQALREVACAVTLCWIRD